MGRRLIGTGPVFTMVCSQQTLSAKLPGGVLRAIAFSGFDPDLCGVTGGVVRAGPEENGPVLAAVPIQDATVSALRAFQETDPPWLALLPGAPPSARVVLDPPIRLPPEGATLEVIMFNRHCGQSGPLSFVAEVVDE